MQKEINLAEREKDCRLAMATRARLDAPVRKVG